MTPDQTQAMKRAIRQLAGAVVDAPPESFVVDTETRDDGGTRFVLETNVKRYRALLIGARGGQTAKELRSLVRSAASAREIPDSVDLFVRG